MKFLSVRELRGNSARVWAELPKEGEMVVTNNGRPVAILSSVGESDLEDSLSSIRSARATTAVAQMQRRSIEKGLDKLGQKEIETEIAAVRRNRKR